jgi:predicted CXXCH cytochrome family protein
VFAVVPPSIATTPTGPDRQAAAVAGAKMKEGSWRRTSTSTTRSTGPTFGCVSVTTRGGQPFGAGGSAKLCFDCHGPAPSADGKQLDTYEMIHGKTAMCLACHKDLKAKDPASKAPTACKDCHGGAE